MLETRAIVVRLEGDEAVVEAKQGGGCGHCSGGNACGSSKLSKLFCSSPRHFRVRNEINANVGEEVQVSVADGVLLRGAFFMYLLPLALMLAGGFLGLYLANGAGRDAYAAIGALLGLVAGFAAARLSASSISPPVIVRREE